MKDIKFLTEKLIAHRELHSKDIIKNTIPSFIKAMELGLAIELDIHILSDNTIVIYHDYNLKRLTNVNNTIENLTYPQLSKIKIKKLYHIPTLKKVMNIINGKVPILIEIKTIKLNEVFLKILLEQLSKYQGKIAIQTINPLVIKWLYKHKITYPLGLIIINKINYKILKKYQKMIDFISVYKKNLPFKTKKIVIGWTIKNIKELNKYKQVSDNLIVENI